MPDFGSHFIKRIKQITGHKPPTYKCYWLCLHFASAEDLARFYMENEPVRTIQPGPVRQLRGGEKLPECVS